RGGRGGGPGIDRRRCRARSPGERRMSALSGTVDTARARPADALAAWARRNAWDLGLVGFLVGLLVFTKLIQPSYGVPGVQGLAISVLPLALAAVAQAIVVLSGGIDLSLGSMMALVNVVAATQMQGQSEEFGVAVVLGALLLGLALDSGPAVVAAYRSTRSAATGWRRFAAACPSVERGSLPTPSWACSRRSAASP